MKEVFVLGAGASAALANLPLGHELIWNYHMDCALCKPIINDVPDMTQDNNQFAGLREFLILASNVYPELKSKVREFDDRGINIFTPFVNEKKYFADEILKVMQENGNQEGILLIKKLILKHLDRKSLARRNAYENFIKKILINKEDNNVSIISFNFDYLLNDYYENGIDNVIYFDYLLDFDYIRENGCKHKNPIPLVKLHGSLDWGLCNKCNKLHLYFPHNLANNYFGEGCPPVCHVGKCDGIIEPYIFLPHQKHDERISSLRNRAEKELREARKITIIGYSFPEYDQSVIELFQRALDDNANVELEVVDYCESNESEAEKIAEIKRKYNDMFPKQKGRLTINLSGFESWLEKPRCPPLHS